MSSAAILDSSTADTLRRAMQHLQRGDLNAARCIAEDGIEGGGDLAALNAFLGMIAARSGNQQAAILHLQAAHHARPEDVTIACNLIAVLIDAGDLAGALAVATSERCIADTSLRLMRYRGFIAQSLEHFEDAITAYEYITGREPSDFDSWNNLGNARAAVGKHAEAVEALERAIALEPKAAPARLNLARALLWGDRSADAEAVLRKAAEDFPNDAKSLHELYVIYKRDGRHEDALTAIEDATRRDPDDASLQLKLGVECGFAMRASDAEVAFRKAIECDPKLVDAYLGLIVQFEHTNREDEFGPIIAMAEANGLEEGPLAFMRAMEHRRSKRFEAGLKEVAKVPPEIEPIRTEHLRATLLDGLGQTDEAFKAFAKTALLHEDNPTEPVRRAAELRETLAKEIDALSKEAIENGSSIQPLPQSETPVFLVGFPRSGTTLLDTILMGHPGTVVLEEKPPLNHVDKEIGGYFGLASLDVESVARARSRYFEEVAAIEPHVHGKRLIDKSPLFMNKVPLIYRLFPNAKFILVIRHPCDVLLSCLMSNFRLNSAMANFLRLDDAAQFYDLNFRHWEASNARFPLNVYPVVYERLIEDVEMEVRPLFDFLGLEWHEEALDHQSTAKARGLITTASYSQVVEPIYKRAVGRWKRYERHLEPILPILEPWVRKFGYSL